MANATIQTDLPELPEAIRDRLVPYRAAEIEEGLRALEYWRPGLFGAMQEALALLEADPAVESISVDFDDEDALYPATIWARTNVSLAERPDAIARLEVLTDGVLARYPDIVLVAVL